MGDVAATIHKDADLASDLEADLGEFPGEFLVDDAIDGQAAAQQALKSSKLIRLETAGIAEDLDGSFSSRRQQPPV